MDTDDIFTEDIGLKDDADTSTDQSDDTQEERQDDESVDDTTDTDITADDDDSDADDTDDDGTDEVTEDTDDDFDAARAKEKIRKVNSEARNLRKEKKALESENGTLKAENTRLKREVSLSARKSIAAKYGLPETFADRLVGEDEAAWKADAKALADELKLSRKPSRTNNPGASRSETPAKLDPADAFFAGI